MSKKYTVKELTSKLLHAGIISLEMIQQSADELNKLGLTEESWKDTQDPKVKRAQELILRMNMFNYVIEPFYGLLIQEFPILKSLIDMCEKNHKQAIKNRNLPEKCECFACEK